MTSLTWFVDDVKQKLDWAPVENSFGIFCGRACFSQKFYEDATAEDREALEDLARLVSFYQNVIGTSYETFCLKHPMLKLLMKPLDLWEVNEGMMAISDAMGAEDEPKWFLKALGFYPATPVEVGNIPVDPSPKVIEFASPFRKIEFTDSGEVKE